MRRKVHRRESLAVSAALLQRVITAKLEIIDRLESEREVLLVRWAAARLAARMLLELQRHRVQFSEQGTLAEGGLLFDAELLQRLIGVEDGDLMEEAPTSRSTSDDCIGGLHGVSSSGGGQPGGGTSSTGAATAAATENNQGSTAVGSGSCTGGGRDAEADGFLAGLPHLKSSASLLRLDGVTRAEVESAKRLSLRAMKQQWCCLVEEGLVMISMLGEAAPDAAAAAAAAAGLLTTTRQDAAAAAAAGATAGGTAGGGSSGPSAAQIFAIRGLQRIGREMDRLLCLACIWNLDVYCQFLVTRADGDEMAWGSSDATLDHWERAMEVAGYQRVQALLFVQLIRNFSAQLDALRSDRAALSRQLQRVSEAPPPATVRRAVSGGGAGSYGAAEQLRGAGDLVERLEINTRQEGAALMLAGQLTRALHTPLQFAKTWALAYPYPMHSLTWKSILEHRLKFSPESFADRVM